MKMAEDLSDVLYVMAGYRNRMVHFYREVTPDELYHLVAKNLNDFDRFVREIAAFVKACKEKNREMQ
jgi:uncharacterized protein YutE (UPF0331/DUF86 family)